MKVKALCVDIERTKALMSSELSTLVEVVSVKSIYDLAQRIEIFIYTSNYLDHLDLTERKIYLNLMIHSSVIACLDINIHKDMTIDQYDDMNRKHPIIVQNERFGISEDELITYGYSYSRLLYERLYHNFIDQNFHISGSENMYELYAYDRISYMLQYPAYKEAYINVMKILVKQI